MIAFSSSISVGEHDWITLLQTGIRLGVSTLTGMAVLPFAPLASATAADARPSIILIISDDHGFPDYDRDAADGPRGRSKLSPYEFGIRTPMFVRWPGKVTAQRDDETLASIIDFAPTILKLAGTNEPADLSGRTTQLHAIKIPATSK